MYTRLWYSLAAAAAATQPPTTTSITSRRLYFDFVSYLMPSALNDSIFLIYSTHIVDIVIDVFRPADADADAGAAALGILLLLLRQRRRLLCSVF